MRSSPTVLHLDMDAFFAAVEQASKPSLRGKPVIVGGLGPRGVVSTASYEARVHGVHSAMAMAHARRLAPNAAYLTPRFTLYRQVSDIVMGLLHELSPLVEPLSLDEAFVDLAAGEHGERFAGLDPDAATVLARAIAGDLRARIEAATGLTASVGLAASKLLAKIGSEAAKPDGLVVIAPGTERAFLGPRSVRTLWGVGPATADQLRRAGITTIAEVAEAGEAELVRLLGRAHGSSLHTMATGRDDRPVVAERDVKSISVEDTFAVDLTDRARVRFEVGRLADRCVGRLRGAGRSGRTIVLKVRHYDFTTLTRSETLRAPTDDPAVVRETAARLLESVDTSAGVRLLGVGVAGLADYTQEDLFAVLAEENAAASAPAPGEDGAPPPEPSGAPPPEPAGRRWSPGQDVGHTEYGPGWVQGSGVGRVTVRFEVPGGRPGRVLTFGTEDPALQPADPLPLTGAPPGEPVQTPRGVSPSSATRPKDGGSPAGRSVSGGGT